MEILDNIIKRTTIRKYRKSKIPSRIIKKILKAGIWGSSIHGIQPWRLVVVSNRRTIERIATILHTRSRKIDKRIARLFGVTADTIDNAPLLILVYNQGLFAKIVSHLFKIKKSMIKIAELSEIEAISGSIQNMLLVANNEGISACWNTMPLFCEKEINEVVDMQEKMIAILTLGFPAEQGKRSKRKFTADVIRLL